jgi:DNA invertase Pin-like site-specific DNA recombinase
LVHKFDRFARNREDSIVYKSMLRKECKIRVISATESLDEEDKMSGLIEAILEAMAEYYSINLAEEVKKGMTERAQQGGFQAAAPLGYTFGNDGILQINEEEAEYIRYIFNQYALNSKGKSQITRRLTDMGVMSKRGNPIDYRNIDYILQNPVYIGKARWTPTERIRRNFNHPDTIITDSQHEGIISQELFQKAADRMAAEKRITQPQRPMEEYVHWLSGLIKCSNCGATLTHNGIKNASPGFQCRGYSRSRCNVSHNLSVKKAERAILEELNHAMRYNGDADFQLPVTRMDDSQDEINLLRKQLGALDGRLLRNKDAYLAGIDTMEEYRRNKETIGCQREELEAEIARFENIQPTIAKAGFTGKVKNVVEILSADCEMKIKQTAIRTIVDRIVYDKPNASIEVYYRDA